MIAMSLTPASDASRRDFLKTSTVISTTSALAASFGGNARAFAAGDDVLKVGLVGCGGRGSGAALQALRADSQTKLVAMGDAFEDNLERSLKNLKATEDIAPQVEVDEAHQFVGLDAYQKVIDAVDVVLLASPPGFRPQHLMAAVEAGKHIFTEKPMATDFGGAKLAMEAVRKAEGNGKAMVAGFCWRYDTPRRELF
ncbi:MAG: Gfo/Idh/MocA family oxidoreductase, partial [Planctomycetaceae bacterium]|nr:Gfo/Idh/MocA family oxidoreductase [Planctomycetaceae bacterium]